MTPSISQTKHQAFARAYRPQLFSEVVGQEHVLQALSYSLDQQTLHHAYLLTGTRGVGKTTLGRIFAKALNCEKGISSAPCGECSACTSITTGRFVDLIEVDGASNTKVEDTRELLEDVQFVPTQGRFKIYLIDEVHMLSTHSFNALLKTLEEPPEHVKFILATTDPQKLPITVVSRCLQFHLQLLPISQIQKHLEHILNQEQIPYENRALYLLAEAAQGSMRDALTLTDQARSQGQGQVLTSQVTTMLGILDQRLAYLLLNAVLKNEPHEIFQTFQQVESTGADSDQVLKDLLELCHQVAMTQALGEQHIHHIINDPGLCEHLIDLARHASAAQIQLCFETLLSARKTLPYASSPATAVRMALLRMACFQQFNTDSLNLADDQSNAAEKKTLNIAAPEIIQAEIKTAQAHKPTAILETQAERPFPTQEPVATDPAAQLIEPPVKSNAADSMIPSWVEENSPPWETESAIAEHEHTQNNDFSQDMNMPVQTQQVSESVYNTPPVKDMSIERSKPAHKAPSFSETLDALVSKSLPDMSLPSSQASSIAPEQKPEPFNGNPAELVTSQSWFQFLQHMNPGGMFGQMLYNSRLTEMQQNSNQWHAHLAVSDSIFGYDSIETPRVVTQFLSKSLNTQITASCSQISGLEELPAELRMKALREEKQAWQNRLHSTPFMTTLKGFMNFTVQTED